MASTAINVSIVGANQIFNEGVGRILENCGSFSMVGTSLTIEGLTDAMPENCMVLLDVSNGSDCVDTIEAVRTRWPKSHIVVLATCCDLEHISAAMQAGADGYLSHAISPEPFVQSLRLIAVGEKVIPSQAVLAMGRPVVTNLVSDVDLSDRDITILRCLANGDSNKMIALALSISEGTIKIHIRNLLRRLNLINRTQAAVWALKHGLPQEHQPAD